MIKTCNRCKLNKDLEDFNKDSKSKDKKQGMCRECHAEVNKNEYLKNPKKFHDRSEIFKKKRRKEIRDFLLNVKISGCVDCGETNPYTLDFDHCFGNKKFAISKMITSSMSLESIKDEVKKCEVRCANCHRIKTALQCNWYKLPMKNINNKNEINHLSNVLSSWLNWIPNNCKNASDSELEEMLKRFNEGILPPKKKYSPDWVSWPA